MADLATWSRPVTEVSERLSALHRIGMACCMDEMPATTALSLGRLVGLLDEQAEDEGFEGYGLLAEVAEQIVEAGRLHAAGKEGVPEAQADDPLARPQELPSARVSEEENEGFIALSEKAASSGDSKGQECSVSLDRPTADYFEFCYPSGQALPGMARVLQNFAEARRRLWEASSKS